MEGISQLLYTRKEIKLNMDTNQEIVKATTSEVKAVEIVEKNKFSNVPPKTFDRNKYGLLKNLNYEFNEDGSVNWRRLIKPEFLVPNKQKTQEKDVSKLKDEELLILLAGIKELAAIRGFTDVTYTVIPSNYSVISVCTIRWIGNYETGTEIIFSATADASPQNTSGIGSIYLTAVAENRSFVRAVRGFLRISILGQEEVSENDGETSPSSDSNVKVDPYGLLRSKMEEKSVSFDRIKAKLIKDKLSNAENINDISEIPKFKVFELIAILSKQQPAK